MFFLLQGFGLLTHGVVRSRRVLWASFRALVGRPAGVWPARAPGFALPHWQLGGRHRWGGRRVRRGGFGCPAPPPLFGRWHARELGSFRCTARRRDRVLAGSGLPLCGVLSRLGGARPGWFGVVWSRARAGSHVGRGRGALASAGWRVVLLQSFGFWRGWCAGHGAPSASFQTKTWSRRWLPRHVLGAPRYPAFPPSRDGALRPRSRRPRGRGTGRPGL